MDIKDIKQQLSILTVLEHYGIKADKNGMANCPFHPDKTPSLQVYPKSNTYCCFSSNCSAGTGDQIQFIELQEKQGKHQAIVKAKEMLGIKTESLNEIFLKLKQNVNKSPKAQQYIKERNLHSEKLEIGYNAETYAQGSAFGQRIDLNSASERKGKVNISTSGVDFDGNDVTETFSLSVLDKEGNIVSTQSQTVTGQSDLSFDIDLQEGQGIYLDRTGGGTSTSVNASTPAKKGTESLSNISGYGTDAPTDQDKQEIGKVLESQEQ